MEDEVLRSALRQSDECLTVEQVARYADGALGVQERTAAENHLQGCLSCQAELALLLAVTSSSVRPDEAALVRDGAIRLNQRFTEIPAGHVPPSSRPRGFRFGAFPVGAVAAVLLIGIAAGGSYLFLRRNAPELPSGVTTTDEVTRSLSVRPRGPIGEQPELPQRFEWFAVDRAVRYRVRLMAVDRQELWSTSTSALGVDLPSPVRASIAPGRTLLWDVTAYDAAGGPIAESGMQSFRVVPR
jgi:hypothetical protein